MYQALNDPVNDELHTMLKLIVQSRKLKKHPIFSNQDHGVPVDAKIRFEERELR